MKTNTINWELLISSIALILGILSFGFTYIRTRKSDKEKRNEFQHKLTIRTLNMLLMANSIKTDCTNNIEYLSKFNHNDSQISYNLNGFKNLLEITLQHIKILKELHGKTLEVKYFPDFSSLRKHELNIKVSENKMLEIRKGISELIEESESITLNDMMA